MKIMYPRDEMLFLLLWKARVLSTRAIWSALFSNASIKTCYERLMKLKKSNHLRRVTVGEGGSVWTLGLNGFQIVRGRLPEMKSPGYGSESPAHDLLVLVAAYGDHWPNLPSEVSILSEEEIKRLTLEHLPSWYPFELLRRPDCLWHLNSDSQGNCIALEMESNLKSVSKYEIIARQYQDAPSVSRVFWFVVSIRAAEFIHQVFFNRFGAQDLKHNFILISDLVAKGWMSTVRVGPDKDRKLENLLKIEPGTSSVMGRRLYHLDLYASPHKSKAYENLLQSDFSNSVTYFKSTPFSAFIKS